MGKRGDDERALREWAEALRRCVFGAQPELSIEQVAGLVSRGSDDPHYVSESTLYAALEGKRKFPSHKLARLMNAVAELGKEPDTAYAPLYWLAQACGHVAAPIAPVGFSATLESLQVIQRMVKEFAEAFQCATAAMAESGDGGVAVTVLEAEEFEREAWDAMRAILHVVEEFKRQAREYRNRI